MKKSAVAGMDKPVPCSHCGIIHKKRASGKTICCVCKKEIEEGEGSDGCDRCGYIFHWEGDGENNCTDELPYCCPACGIPFCWKKCAGEVVPEHEIEDSRRFYKDAECAKCFDADLHHGGEMAKYKAYFDAVYTEKERQHILNYPFVGDDMKAILKQ